MLHAAFNITAGFDDGSNIPKNYNYIQGHKNQDNWWDSMKFEFSAMESKNVWKIIDMKDLPHGRKIIGIRAGGGKERRVSNIGECD